MAQLYPSNFDLAQLASEGERRAFEKLLTGLDDSWFVVPDVAIVVNGGDSEIDFVLLSRDNGAFCVEVKGGMITVENGHWKSNGTPIDNPAHQSSQAKHNLIHRLRSMKVDLKTIFIQHLVAFPDIIDFPAAGAGPDCPREMVLTGPDLDYAQEFLAHLRHPKAQVTSESSMLSMLKALRPDVRDVEVDGRYVKGVSQRIDRITRANLNVLLPLDVNKRLFIEGAAGTGKTYLGQQWAHRSLIRGERTLFVCYNRALGSELRHRISNAIDAVPSPDLLQAGSFHAIANQLLGENAPRVAADADQHFWDTRHAELLISHRNQIDIRFDTIIIDEGQDFQPLWFDALEGLLADPTDSRMYLMADPRQAIFSDSPVPTIATTRIPLEVNIRNTDVIARIVNRLGGAGVSPHATPGPRVEVSTISGAKERRKKIAAAVKTANEELNIPLSQILIAVPHRSDVLGLIGTGVGDYKLVPWNERSEDAVACATIQGTKGLERLAVIVSSMDTEPDPRLTYVGASRASVFLALIGSPEFISQISTETLAP